MRRGNLAEEVLKEVPEQVVGWAESAHYQPVKVEADMTSFNNQQSII
jgi:hypothetical protein